MSKVTDFIKHSGIQAFSEIDNQFSHETVWAARSDDDVEERLKSYAKWLKKALSEYIDATIEKGN